MSVVPGPAPFVVSGVGRARTPVPPATDEASVVLPRPRPSPEGVGAEAVVPGAASGPEPQPLPGATGARVYADGSALSRYLEGAPCREEWLAWAARHESELVTTPLALTELRAIAGPRGLDARGVAQDVADRLEVVRISDQALRQAAKVSGVVSAFHALHVGAAVAHPEVHAVATYDTLLAQVCVLFGLEVVSPGWPDRWWEQG
ncbi:type II toxin-antitoxin system VapC family toxin [Cellulomonas soli]|uniref:type II toxin-antitoxin system VapC family toxin n=1 Tax=Cellulomonas soli TaxID=931535 RepID=UPI003F859EF0